MHHPKDRIAHTTATVIPIVEHWLEREISQCVPHRSMSYISLGPVKTHSDLDPVPRCEPLPTSPLADNLVISLWKLRRCLVWWLKCLNGTVSPHRCFLYLCYCILLVTVISMSDLFYFIFIIIIILTIVNPRGSLKGIDLKPNLRTITGRVCTRQ